MHLHVWFYNHIYCTLILLFFFQLRFLWKTYLLLTYLRIQILKHRHPVYPILCKRIAAFTNTATDVCEVFNKIYYRNFFKFGLYIYIYVYTYPCHAQTPRVVHDAIIIVEFYLPFCFGIYKNNAYNVRMRIRRMRASVRTVCYAYISLARRSYFFCTSSITIAFINL